MREIEVAVGILRNSGRYLLTERREGQHLAGTWEFPGGKISKGETAHDALVRELREEVGFEVRTARLFHREVHRYTDREVTLQFFLCDGECDEIAPREGQEMRWLTLAEMGSLPLPAANRQVIALLAEQEL